MLHDVRGALAVRRRRLKNKRKQRDILAKVIYLKDQINHLKDEKYERRWSSDEEESFDEMKQRSIEMYTEEFNYYNDKLPDHIKINLEPSLD